MLTIENHSLEIPLKPPDKNAFPAKEVMAPKYDVLVRWGDPFILRKVTASSGTPLTNMTVSFNSTDERSDTTVSLTPNEKMSHHPTGLEFLEGLAQLELPPQEPGDISVHTFPLQSEQSATTIGVQDRNGSDMPNSREPAAGLSPIRLSGIFKDLLLQLETHGYPLSDAAYTLRTIEEEVVAPVPEEEEEDGGQVENWTHGALRRLLKILDGNDAVTESPQQIPEARIVVNERTIRELKVSFTLAEIKSLAKSILAEEKKVAVIPRIISPEDTALEEQAAGMREMMGDIKRPYLEVMRWHLEGWPRLTIEQLLNGEGFYIRNPDAASIRRKNDLSMPLSYYQVIEAEMGKKNTILLTLESEFSIIDLDVSGERMLMPSFSIEQPKVTECTLIVRAAQYDKKVARVLTRRVITLEPIGNATISDVRHELDQNHLLYGSGHVTIEEKNEKDIGINHHIDLKSLFDSSASFSISSEALGVCVLLPSDKTKYLYSKPKESRLWVRVMAAHGSASISLPNKNEIRTYAYTASR